MKKRMVSLMMAGVMAVSLAGCVRKDRDNDRRDQGRRDEG